MALPRAAAAAPQAAQQASEAVPFTAPQFDSLPSGLARAANSAAESDPGGSKPSSTSKSDAVLANAVVVDVAELSLGDRLAQLLTGDDLQRRFEEVQRRALEDIESRRDAVSTSIVATGTLSIGYVVWLIRGGVLMSSMLSALPAWQMIDPLPVLAAKGNQRARRQAAKADEGDVERLFDEGNNTRTQAAQSARTPSVQATAAAPQRLRQLVDETAGTASAEDPP